MTTTTDCSRNLDLGLLVSIICSDKWNHGAQTPVKQGITSVAYLRQISRGCGQMAMEGIYRFLWKTESVHEGKFALKCSILPQPSCCGPKERDANAWHQAAFYTDARKQCRIVRIQMNWRSSNFLILPEGQNSIYRRVQQIKHSETNSHAAPDLIPKRSRFDMISLLARWTTFNYASLS